MSQNCALEHPGGAPVPVSEWVDPCDVEVTERRRKERVEEGYVRSDVGHPGVIKFEVLQDQTVLTLQPVGRERERLAVLRRLVDCDQSIDDVVDLLL